MLELFGIAKNLSLTYSDWNKKENINAKEGWEDGLDTNAATAKGCFLPRPATSPGFQLFAGYGMVRSRPKGWGGMVLTAQD